MKVAVDIGYGFTKAVSSSGGKVCFPSAVAPVPLDLLAGALGRQGPGHRLRVRYLSGKVGERVVGEAALRGTAAVTTLNREKPEDLHDWCLLAAVYLAGGGGAGQFPEPVDLAVGLPLAYYRSQRDALRERLLRLRAWVSVDGGEERCVSFSRVLVLPQGAGAVAAFPDLLPPSGLVGVVDVGEYTTDYLVLEARGRGEFVPLLRACGSAEVGAHLVREAVAAAYLEKTGATLPRNLVAAAVREGRAPFRGKEVDLSAEVELALRDAARAVAQAVLSAWKELADALSATVLAGGGSLLLGRSLFPSFPGARLLPDPVFANALGFLRALGQGEGR
ncbi:ParM/StbA family protein [Ammonifex thiophilus]|uniref:Uncharacterized protein n=1 Tax=Ammonifex thiophilus TaxID=444093 RepID=A0A3D8P1R9_9THEO|nr:ParM/StbA family protein [Ammonifex thiophilus]RDV81789.1 hypothetical protein DXX99_08795 [Ammonifex thiophilus]